MTGATSMIGKTVSHSCIVERIGEGGMGAVYRAEDTRLGRFVALKFLPDSFASDADRRARLMLEARAVSRLSSPFIATLYDVAY